MFINQNSSSIFVLYSDHILKITVFAGLVLIFTPFIPKFFRSLSLLSIFQPNKRKSLTQEDAVEIYKHKLHFMQASTETSRQARAKFIKSESVALAIRYRVSPQAIRDIWKRKTWVAATSHLWAEGPGATH